MRQGSSTTVEGVGVGVGRGKSNSLFIGRDLPERICVRVLGYVFCKALLGTFKAVRSVGE